MPNENDIKKQKHAITKSFGHAMRGIRRVFRTERNFKLHCIAVAIVVLIGISLEWELVKWCIAILSMVTVLATEMTNTAIEYTWNHLEPNHHPVVGVIKDVMAGAVLVVSIGALIVGLMLIFSSSENFLIHF